MRHNDLIAGQRRQDGMAGDFLVNERDRGKSCGLVWKFEQKLGKVRTRTIVLGAAWISEGLTARVEIEDKNAHRALFTEQNPLDFCLDSIDAFTGNGVADRDEQTFPERRRFVPHHSAAAVEKPEPGKGAGQQPGHRESGNAESCHALPRR